MPTRPYSAIAIARQRCLTSSAICSLTLTLLLPVLAAGCGKKGPPLAPIVRIPAAIQTIAPRRLGSDVYVTLTVPDVNIDGSKPADIGRIEVYAYTGLQNPGARIMAAADLIATIPVAPIPRDEKGRPLPPVERVPGAVQGASVTIRETLSAESLQPRPLPPPPARRGALPPPLIDPSAPIPPVQRFYVAVGYGDRNRTSTGGTIAEQPLGQLPDPPTGVIAEYTPEVVRLRWEPSGGLLGFILDRELPADPAPVDDPAAFVAPFDPGAARSGAPPARAAAPPARQPSVPPTGQGAAPAGAVPGLAGPAGSIAPTNELPPGPTRYNVYREMSDDPLVLPGPPREGWAAEIPAPANAAPLTELRFEDAIAFDGRERCYQVRAVRGEAAAAVESEASPRICFTPIDTVAPAVPTGLAAEVGDGAISLIWDPNIEEDLAGYVVLRGAPGDATLTVLTPTLVPTARYVDRSVTPGMRYVYAVAAVDNRVPLGNVSDASGRIEETAR